MSKQDNLRKILDKKKTLTLADEKSIQLAILKSKMYGLYWRLDLASQRKHGVCFSQLLALSPHDAIEILREVAGGDESFKTLVELLGRNIGM